MSHSFIPPQIGRSSPTPELIKAWKEIETLKVLQQQLNDGLLKIEGQLAKEKSDRRRLQAENEQLKSDCAKSFPLMEKERLENPVFEKESSHLRKWAPNFIIDLVMNAKFTSA